MVCYKEKEVIKTTRRKKLSHLEIGKSLLSIKAEQETPKENMIGLFILKGNMTTKCNVTFWNRKGISGKN